MKTSSLVVQAALISTLALSSAVARAEGEWVAINGAGELENLLAGRAIMAKFWSLYLRPDGKMAESYPPYPISFHGWFISDDSKLCTNVLGMPDKVMECASIQRHSVDPERILYKSAHGTFDVRLADPPQELIDALEEKVGPQ